jgi:tetratricopeptide (TPR) repeat protein
MNIVLTTMVKNESKVLTRMLTSCLGVATHYVVNDTGSTDKTRELARMWGTQHSVPLTVFKTEFKDFGASRTLTLNKGKEFVKSAGLDPKETYLLLLDADMELKTDGFDPLSLKDDVYRVEQVDSGMRYWNTRLVRADKECRYIGKTHEYIDISDATSSNLNTLYIADHGDGGCKADKLERDERLLTADLEENPNSERTLYYLGATYEYLGKNEKAYDMFTRRIAAGGFEEEAWMAQYHRGIVSLTMGNTASAESDFMTCFQKRPWRAEPLAKLCDIHTKLNNRVKACAFAMAGVNIPFPKDDILFVEHNTYRWTFPMHLMINSYYTKDAYNGIEWCDYLASERGSPYRDLALSNSPWYSKKLKSTLMLDLGILISSENLNGWYPCNPSIIPGDKGYDISVRTVNYKIRPDGSYDYPGKVMTVTYFVQTDKNFNVIGKPIKLENPKSSDKAIILGIEDVRLYMGAMGEISALGTRCDGIESTPQIYKTTWDMNGKLKSCDRISAPGKTEKNWLPAGEDRAFYSTSPLTVVDFKGNTVSETPTKKDFSFMRGGSSPIGFKGGYLWVAHQVGIIAGQTKRTYLHRFCWISTHDQSDIRFSRPFYFRDKCIEFCSGACIDPNGDILLTFGFEDNSAWLTRVPQKEVEALLDFV